MQKALKSIQLVITLVLACFTLSGWAAEFESVPISLVSSTTKIELSVEFAESFEQRSHGLMFRESLCAQCGMLFQYEQPQVGSMWMKNTLIPLDVAFISKSGVITDILSMKPHDLTSTRSSGKVLFALEMNVGWFAENQISVGDKLIFVK